MDQTLAGQVRGDRTFRLALVLLVIVFGAVLTVTAYHGYAYYKLPVSERYKSALHKQFKPGGTTGHALGISGAAMLIGLLSYSLRKRVRRMRNLGKLSSWLQFHILLGVTAPFFITLHTAFKLRGIVAISYWSMMIVFISGLIGRYLYAQIPHALSEQESEQPALENELQEINHQLQSLLRSDHYDHVTRRTEFTMPSRISSAFALFQMIGDDLKWIFKKRAVLNILKSYKELTPGEVDGLIRLVRRRALQIRRILFLRSSQNLFRHWHVIHLPLAQTMYLTMILHIVITIMTGYL